LERPNLYRWQFTPGVYDDFPRKGLSAWTLQEIKGCNTALDQNLCYVVSVQDDSSNSTPNSRHDRSSADSRVVLGTPERSPVPHNLEEYPDDLAAGLCHDFDLRDPVGHLQQVTERLQDFRHHLEQRERDFRAVIKQQNATIEKLKRDLKARDDVASGMDELLSSLGRLRTENANLKAQIDGLEDQNAKIKGQNNEVKAQIDGLKDQNTKLKEQNNEVRAQNDALRTTKDELKAQHDQLKTRQIDAKQQFSSEKAGLKAENMKLNTKQLVLEKQVYTFQRLYANSKKRLPSCHTCEENLKEVNEFFEATLRNLPDQDCDSYTPTNKALGHIQAHLDENFRLSKTGQNAGAELTGRPTGTIMRQEKNDIFKSFLRDPIDSNDPKVPAKPSSMQAPSSKRKPTEEPQHHDPKRQRNDSKVSKKGPKLSIIERITDRM
jgi:myosin heavy subunit